MSGLNDKIQKLGFTKATNVNELAARGVKLSFRDEIISKLKKDEEMKSTDGKAESCGAGEVVQLLK